MATLGAVLVIGGASLALGHALDEGSDQAGQQQAGTKRGSATHKGARQARQRHKSARPVKPRKASALPKPALVWAVGDGADGGAAGKQLAQMIASSPLDRFLYLGDVYEGTSLAGFESKYATTYGRLNRFAAPTPGNHEWNWHDAGYDRYWEQTTQRPQPPWYAFALGGWQLLSLNSEADHSSGSAQVSWLRQQLDRRPGFGSCRIAYWHRPFHSGGMHGDAPDIAGLWNPLRGRATIVLNGHDHDMQRFAPLDGITEFVAGSGGRDRYPVHQQPGMRFSNDSEFGALRLRLSPGQASYAFVGLGGQVLDSGTLRCQPG
ncbi:MAG: hypothetical protein QOJ38_1490 [Solirubrobacterales bacterium]|jgi:hypothetical protein|nr:hypothetical protein [Solirubrobacterales bacterium]